MDSLNEEGEDTACAIHVQSGQQNAQKERSIEQRNEIERILRFQNDHKAILQVTQTSSLEDIKRAYKRLSLLLHPDKNKNEGATEAFRAVSEAYVVLSRPSDVFNPEEISPHDVFRSFYPNGCPSETLRDEAVLGEMAYKIRHDWFEIGARLEIDPNVLEGLTGSGTYKALPLRMLYQWKRQCDCNEKQQKEKLLCALHKCLPRERDLANFVLCHQGPIEMVLPDIAKNLHACWESFGHHLGLEQSLIEELKAPAKGPDDDKAAFKMLLHWKKTTRNDTSILRPLQQAGRSDIVDWLDHQCGLLTIENIDLPDPSKACSVSEHRCGLLAIENIDLPDPCNAGSVSAIKKSMQMLSKTYRRYAKNFSIFKKNKNLRKYVVDITKLFTNLTLLEGTPIQDDSDGTPVNIEQALSYGKKNLVLVGPPGSGKSSVLLHIANSWGRKFDQDAALSTSHSGNDEMVDSGHQLPGTETMLGDIEQLVYIRPQDCKSSLDETVESILRRECRKDSQAALDHYHEHRTKTAILVDSLDEVMDNKEFIQDIYGNMKDNERMIIVGCRSNHPVLDDIYYQCDFNWIRTEGFDESHIIEYVKRYFKHGQPSEAGLVDIFKEAVEKDKRLAKILSNPLVLSVLCILLKSGKVQVQDLHGLTKIAIFQKIEELAMEREDYGSHSCSNLELFRKFSLVALMEGGSGIFEKNLKEWGIEPELLPFVCFDDADIANSSLEKQVIWPHQSFLEYDAASYLLCCDEETRKFILTYLASQRHLFNVLIFVLELLEIDFQEIGHICTTILSLQTKVKNPKSKDCSCTGNETLRQIMSELQISECLDHIPLRYINLKTCKDCWLASKHVFTMEGRAVFCNAVMCMQTILDQTQRFDVFRSSLAPLVPGGLHYGETMQAVPKTDRCVGMTTLTNGAIRVTANRPSDITSSSILSNLTNAKPSPHLSLYTNLHAEVVYGDEEHIPSVDDWQGLFQSLDNKSRSTLTIYHNSDCDSLFLALPSVMMDLYTKNVRRLFIRRPTINVAAIFEFKQQLENEKWTVKDGKNECSIIHRDDQQEMTIELVIRHANILLPLNGIIPKELENLSDILNPARRCITLPYSLRLQIPEKTCCINVVGNNIYIQRLLDVHTTGALSLYAKYEVEQLHLEIEETDSNYAVSYDESKSVIDDITKHPIIAKDGLLTFLFRSKNCYDDLLCVISEMVEQLVTGLPGIRIVLRQGVVTGGTLLALLRRLSQMWNFRKCCFTSECMGLYRKGGDQEMQLALQLSRTTIFCVCEEEKAKVEELTDDIGILHRTCSVAIR